MAAVFAGLEPNNDHLAIQEFSAIADAMAASSLNMAVAHSEAERQRRSSRRTSRRKP
jgi:hypothetical protein